MNKLYTLITWNNGTTPALNEDNLNAMSQALDGIDDRVVELGGDVLEVVPYIQSYLSQAEDLVEALYTISQNPPYIGANGNWYVWDANTQEFVDSGVDASISVTLAEVVMINTEDDPYVTNTGTPTDPIFHLYIPRGETGIGIVGISKTSSSGLVDTYTITYTDGNTSTFTVTNGAGMLINLEDVNITSPSDGQVLKYDNTSHKWVNGTGGGGGSSTLSGLTDVNITSASNGQVLKYDTATQKWVNGTGGSSTLDGLTDVDISTLADGQHLIYSSQDSKWQNVSKNYADIDDTLSSASQTWSSSKISLELSNKADEDELPIWSSAVACAVGATSCTITDAAIATTSIIEPFCDSSTPIPFDSITVTSGQVVIAFDELEAATNFKVRITN